MNTTTINNYPEIHVHTTNYVFSYLNYTIKRIIKNLKGMKKNEFWNKGQQQQQAIK